MDSRSRVDSHTASNDANLAAELERVAAERQQLQELLDLRTCVLDSSSAHFMIIDMTRPGAPIMYVNRALAKDHGYEPEELIGQSAATLVTPELNPESLTAVNNALRRGESARAELLSRRKDGTALTVGISLQPVRNALGQVTHYVSIGADITVRLREAAEKRALQDQLVNEMREREQMAIDLRLAQKLESVGRLASGIAHEINTPIQYIGDSVAFLQSGLSDLDALICAYRAGNAAPEHVEWEFLREEMPKAIDRALDGISRVAGIVRAMKEFAHPDGAEQNPADLNRAIETTLTVARGEYKYVASVDTSFGDIPEVLCNVGELNQVFLNLIVNAAHAITAAGKDPATGRIRICTTRAGDCVELVFIDNGCGIPEQHMEKIFDPFFTTKEVGKGTGQGLAIARSIIVDKHCGDIDVRSRPGLGTRFRIRLPIAGRGQAQ